MSFKYGIDHSIFEIIDLISLNKYNYLGYISRGNASRNRTAHREILLNQTEIRLYLPFSDWFGTKQTYVWFQINRRMINTIWFRFYLIRFRKNFSVCKDRHEMFVFFYLSFLFIPNCWVWTPRSATDTFSTHYLTWHIRVSVTRAGVSRTIHKLVTAWNLSPIKNAIKRCPFRDHRVRAPGAGKYSLQN